MLILAITFQAILILYHQATTLFDFFPFNGVRFYKRHETLTEAGINLALMSLPLAGFILRVTWMMKFGVTYYFILFAVECATWWGPYFLGASPKGQESYNRIHSRTITPIFRRGNNPAPNLEHLILMALTLLAAATTLMAFRFARVPFSHWWIGLLIGAAMTGGTIYQFCFLGKEKAQPNTHPAEPKQKNL